MDSQDQQHIRHPKELTNKFLIANCVFIIINLVFKQDIPMRIDTDPFWGKKFRYFFELKHVKSLISLGLSRAYKYHEKIRFVDVLCAINDSNEFFKPFDNIYPKELALKVQHRGTHVSFLELDITIDYITNYITKIIFLYISCLTKEINLHFS